MTTKPRYKLTLSKLDFVSAVDQPAQETATVAIIKRRGQTDAVTATCRVAKVDEQLGIVMGFAFTTTVNGAPYHDLQGDAIDDGDVVKVAAEFMAAGGYTDEMHDEEPDGRVVFCWPLTAEIAKALQIETARTGLLVGIKPSPTVLAKFKTGEYTGFSIGGTGQREVVKSDVQCAKCSAYTTKDADYCVKCGAAMKRVTKATWTTAYVDDLPDSAFLYVEPGGKKDDDGKTTPRSLRHFPYKDASGKIDVPHLRDAIGRIPQSSLPATKREALQARAEKLLGKQHKRVVKQAVLTSEVDGHQHGIDLDDPADGWNDPPQTSYATSEGADQSHCHVWTYDDQGVITIAVDSGHTHTVSAVVPADVLARVDADDAVPTALPVEESSGAILILMPRSFDKMYHGTKFA